MTAALNRAACARALAASLMFVAASGAFANPLCTHDGTAFRCVDASGSKAVAPPPDFQGRGMPAPWLAESLPTLASEAGRAVPGGVGGAKSTASAPLVPPAPPASPRASPPLTCTGTTEGVRCQ